MSSYDKLVKLACKPKAAPPKAKYLDPIIAATWSDDGAVHDVCKALTPRFREPNSIVVFKALIVLHTMIRNGATDNILSYLCQTDVLKLRNVSTGNWEGYAAPQNLQHYANYLDSRIRAYHDLKHDAVRVQAESNRDMRNSISIEEEGYRSRKDRNASKISSSTTPTRSKTMMGRKLRVMTVEKGLLRETKVVHRMIDALVECRFYLDDLEDELTITALRMLVKDLLILFQAGNEGVINVLEHYFEMSHVDAAEALTIYRHFCQQTEHVVEYLSVARKLQNLLNVSIPNLKHAPVSLASALQEYLDDANFDQNRIEYKTNKAAAEGGSGKKSNKKPDASAMPNLPSSSSSKLTTSKPENGSTPKNQGIVDFFSSIEEQPASPSPPIAQQGPPNPFTQMAMNGQQFMQSSQLAVQPTGLIVPQQTAFQPSPNPFGLMVQQQQPGHRPFSAFVPQQTSFPQQGGFLQPQRTDFLQPQQTGFLQPQATGSNPFRQSMMFPQSTGMELFSTGGGGNPTSAASNAFGTQNLGYPQENFMAQNPQNTNQPSAPTPFASFSNGVFTPVSGPPRPASTPLTSGGILKSATSPPVAEPVKTHQTGTRNPFGPIITPVPPVPKPPTLMELSMRNGQQFGQQTAQFGLQNGQLGQQDGSLDLQNGQSAQQIIQFGQQPQQSQQLQQQKTGTNSAFGFSSGALNAGPTDISSIASSFAFSNKSTTSKDSNSNSSQTYPLSSQNTSSATTGSMFSDSMFSSSGLSSQSTGVAASTSSPSFSSSLKPQMTGFAGLKPFKPSSSFGASLLESLPPIPGSAPTTPAITGSGSAGVSSSLASSYLSGIVNSNTQANSQAGMFGSGSSLGQGLRPQMTGGGAANPFRASMMNPTSSTMPNFSMTPTFNLGLAGSPNGALSGAQPSAGNTFGGFGFNLNSNPGLPQQQQNSASLI